MKVHWLFLKTHHQWSDALTLDCDWSRVQWFQLVWLLSSSLWLFLVVTEWKWRIQEHESRVCVSVNRNRDVCVTHLIFKSSSSGIDPLCEHDSDLTQNHDSVFIRSSVILIIIQLIHYDYVSSVKWNKPRRFSGFPARLWLQELPPVPPAPPAPRPPWETRLLGPGWLVVVGRKF